MIEYNNPNKVSLLARQYSDAVKYIKDQILLSRNRAASVVNKELLGLYFFIGEYISVNSRSKNWGKGAVETISQQLQVELPGLRGFSATNIKNMRIFYEEWQDIIENRQTATAGLNNVNSKFRQLASAELTNVQMDAFTAIGFSHHREIIRKCKNRDEMLFYIRQCASGFWSVEKLKYYLTSDLFNKKVALQNNFSDTISNIENRAQALNSFKDEYILDFINIQDQDEEADERIFEHEIVNNIRKFIMALGSDFSFIGNQYRLIIEEDEFFIDLLFFNRRLQSLVAIELKKGKFKAEYAGKMNMYLSALDEYVRLPNENPSIGIILCKEKNNKVVEFSFRDTSKPMGVAIYKTVDELPEKYRDILPDAEKLKNLM